MGDGILISFGLASEAVRCAIEILIHLKNEKRNVNEFELLCLLPDKTELCN
jgi:class 3 adenylate cyclase